MVASMKALAVWASLSYKFSLIGGDGILIAVERELRHGSTDNFPDHDYTIHVLKSVKVLDGDCAVTEASEDMTDERAMSVGHDESIRQPDLLRAVDTKRFGHHLDID